MAKGSTGLTLRLPARRGSAAPAAVPRVLRSTDRGDVAGDRLLDAALHVESVVELAAPGRGDAEVREPEIDGARLLALEAADGTTVFIRADRLAEELARLYPDEALDGTLDVRLLRDRGAASRGALDWVWSRISVLRLDRDAITDLATDKAREWVEDWLGEKAASLVAPDASWLGAKALMWAIESQLAGEPGLYLWRGDTLSASDRCVAGDPRLEQAAAAGPMLVFIHGTGSHTMGGFKDLRAAGAEADWGPIARRFGERVFGLEHRTFSESPIDNALQLLRALPVGARVSLVSHSRGGLVGDLVCIGALSDESIAAYRREAPPNQKETEQQKRLREKVVAEEQAKLRELRELLDSKKLQIERYVRVASPARGTTLLSDNLDVFLSGLLSLASRMVGAVTGPAGGAVMSVFRRVVLEIADKRVDARLVPGIEAMLTDSPLGALLARSPRRQGLAMSVIAGDIEGGGVLKQLGVMFTDWMFFDRADNDLVVDTDSMYGGLAALNDTRYLFDKGEAVNHFSYFARQRTRSAMRDWLTVEQPEQLGSFSVLERARVMSFAEARSRADSRGAAPEPNTRPVTIYLPGIMGSHLEVRKSGKPGDGDRVWFDFFDLNWGGLEKIRMGKPAVEAESLFGMFYEDLAEYLERSETVVRFPYDWRQPIQSLADRFAKVVDEALAGHPDQPVRLLAHSMGGLVSRAMIALHRDLWARIVARPGGRLVMLGTPNRGSHAMVETLLAKSDSMRKLELIDIKHDMQEVLDIVGGFYGGVQLLPRPGFDDGGTPWKDYYGAAAWSEMRKLNRDRWLGDGLVGNVSDATFQRARVLWDEVLTDSSVPHPERVAYVFGQGKSTPCGVRKEGAGTSERLKMVATSEGDGTVSWAAGRLDNLPAERCWYMPVEHGALTATATYFPAIRDLLERGETPALERLPVSRGESATWTYDAAPPSLPVEEELARSFIGSRPQRKQAQAAKRRLGVAVRAMDLRFVQYPILCGHYIGDAISGAERRIDSCLVDGALSQRERLGVYAGEIGSSAVVLQARNDEVRKRGTGRGAVIVGLGEYGSLSVSNVSETVRSGVLRLLLHTLDREGGEPAVAGEGRELTLASLLIGYNSTTHISVVDSIAAIVRGVLEGNRQFNEAMPKAELRVGRLEFVELFTDTAISAGHAIQELPERMAADLRRLEAHLEPQPELIEHESARPRLSVFAPFGYWPRLMVTDDDRVERECEKQADADSDEGASAVRPRKPAAPVIAENIRYVFLSERARAESVVQQRQPGLIESLVKNAIGRDGYDPDLSRTLFQLMVPLDFKAAAREAEQMVLVVDGYTANLPWEMLQAEDLPMVLKTAVVRQFASTRYRKTPRSTTRKTACVIANPDTSGYRSRLLGAAQDNQDPAKDRLPPLAGAAAEGQAVRRLLEAAHYDVTYSDEGAALDVFARLFRQPYRVLVIAAHGVFELMAADGRPRTGVVLSDGMLLTAAEVRQMEVVPELVFLNCCHLGAMSATPETANRLAYSLSRELIEMGVRCVVAAGWQVNDDAARCFAETFFGEFVSNNTPFGNAVHAARKAIWERWPQCNTWGAYQVYGDPHYRLEPGAGSGSGRAAVPVSPAELIAELGRLRIDAHHDAGKDLPTTRKTVTALLERVPASWRECAEVQAALGALYGEFFPAGAEDACAAYGRAILADDPGGKVPVKAIEQLANLEARAGADCADVKRGEALIRSAIARLEALTRITGPEASLELALQHANVERRGLLGGAYKRLAVCLARGATPGSNWPVVKAELERAQAVYLAGERPAASPDFDLYTAINRLQFAALTGASDAANGIRLAETCQTVARQRFAASGDFFDAIGPADALLAIRLLDGRLVGSVDEIARTYREAAQGVSSSLRQFNSVVSHLRMLADLVRARAVSGDDRLEAALHELASGLDPKNGSATTAAAIPAAGAAAPNDRPSGAQDNPPAAKGRARAAAAPRAASKRARTRAKDK